MKNLENKIQILNENRGETSLYEYIETESQSDPGFFRWLFNEDLEQDFDTSLNDSQKAEFNFWMQQLKKEYLLEKWIVVQLPYADQESAIRITKRENFTEMNLCEAYEDYGVQVDCNVAGCYSFNNTNSEIFDDFYNEASEKFGFNEDTLDELELTHRGLYEMIIEQVGSVAYETMKEFIPNWDDVISFFKTWREANECHIEVTGWTYHDSHNFQTVISKTDCGEPDCAELDEDEQAEILMQMPSFPHIEGTNASEETEDFIFHFDRWADNPWYCYVTRK